jgi:hypothetical protein
MINPMTCTKWWVSFDSFDLYFKHTTSCATVYREAKKLKKEKARTEKQKIKQQESIKGI